MNLLPGRQWGLSLEHFWAPPCSSLNSAMTKRQGHCRTHLNTVSATYCYNVTSTACVHQWLIETPSSLPLKFDSMSPSIFNIHIWFFPPTVNLGKPGNHSFVQSKPVLDNYLLLNLFLPLQASPHFAAREIEVDIPRKKGCLEWFWWKDCGKKTTSTTHFLGWYTEVVFAENFALP